MVQLTEVEDEHFQNPQVGPEDDDFTDTDSEISSTSDYDPLHESLTERISALRDIIPPTTRSYMWHKYLSASRIFKTTLFFCGRAAWTVSVSALLIGVPWALCWAEEQQISAMEQEQRMREQGADMLTQGGGLAGEKVTAEGVRAAL